MTTEMVVRILNLFQSVVNWLAARGVARDRVLEMLAESQGRDLTTAEVQAELDATDSELNDTQRLIDALEQDQ